MSNAALNNITRDAIMQIYQTRGKAAADTKLQELLKQCEDWKIDARQRGTIKGELSEIALEYHLLWWLEQVENLVCVKSLCVKSKTSNATAEVDILLATPFRVYLFECKSFKGKKTVSNECYLEGESSSKDVYEQSKYHLLLLEEHLQDCRPVSSKKWKTAPYQLVLFELSTNDLKDIREPKWQRAIPALTFNTLDSWLLNEFSKEYPIQWDFNKLVKRLEQLDTTSERMFNFHMKKITERNRKGKQ